MTESIDFISQWKQELIESSCDFMSPPPRQSGTWSHHKLYAGRLYAIKHIENQSLLRLLTPLALAPESILHISLSADETTREREGVQTIFAASFSVAQSAIDLLHNEVETILIGPARLFFDNRDVDELAHLKRFLIERGVSCPVFIYHTIPSQNPNLPPHDKPWEHVVAFVERVFK